MDNLVTDDVLLRIFQFLSLTERFQAELVCKRWQNLMPYDFVELNLFKWLGESVSPQTAAKFLNYAVLRFGSRLETVTIGIPNLLITSVMVEDLVLYCSKLNRLDLSFCKITDSTLNLLIDLSDRLTHLNLANMQFSMKIIDGTDIDNMRILFSNLDHLISINLQRARVDLLWAIPYLPSTIQFANLNNCGPMRPHILREFLLNTPDLRELRLSTYNQFDSGHLDIICTYETLEIFELSHVSFANLIFGGQQNFYSLARLKVLKNLRELHVQFNDVFNQDNLNGICSKCRFLEVLDLRNCRKLDSFEPLYLLKNLKILRVAANANFTDKDLTQIAQNGNLTKFTADRCDIGTFGISQLAFSCGANLTELSVNNCNSLDESVLSVLEQNSPKLTSLSLQNCGLTDDSFNFAYTSGFAMLRNFDISFNDISDVGIGQFVINLCEGKPTRVPLDLYTHQCQITSESIRLATAYGIRLHQ